MGKNRRGEWVICLDADTGQGQWRYNYGRFKEPGSTPAVDGKFLYAVSYDGIAVCLKTKNGDLVWSRDLTEDFGALEPKYGYGSSPLVMDSLVVLNTRLSGIALRKDTGGAGLER
jgi:outer membrane protein assembly factor BamB